MNTENNYIEINKRNWNQRVELHLNSEFYQMEEFLKGQSSLNTIELDLLGDIKGLKILHLQCHFGQDTLSLARLGAHVTGVDLSNLAIENAQKLARELQLEAQFICCDVYQLPKFLEGTFDLIYTSYGTIGWLPDLEAWASLINKYLKPNGRLVFVEFHPVVWMFDNAFETIEYSYFKTEPIIESLTGTYAAKDSDSQFDSVTWNHSISEVLQALLKQGLRLNDFQEYNYSPYNCLQGMIAFEPQKYCIEKWGTKLPLVYSLVAQK